MADIVERLRALADTLADTLDRHPAYRAPIVRHAADEIERLRSWMHEAINELADPCDACDFDDSEQKALLATINNAIGKLRIGLQHDDEQEASPVAETSHSAGDAK